MWTKSDVKWDAFVQKKNSCFWYFCCRSIRPRTKRCIEFFERVVNSQISPSHHIFDGKSLSILVRRINRKIVALILVWTGKFSFRKMNFVAVWRTHTHTHCSIENEFRVRSIRRRAGDLRDILIDRGAKVSCLHCSLTFSDLFQCVCLILGFVYISTCLWKFKWNEKRSWN